MFGSLVLIQIIEAIIWLPIICMFKSGKRKKLLQDSGGKRLRFIDDAIRKRIGKPSKIDNIIAKRITKIARNVTNTQAFELGIKALFGVNSPVRKKIIATLNRKSGLTPTRITIV
jgi:hypothetical protein